MRTKQQKISLLIPFKTKDAHRQKVFNWLLDYWRSELPEAEIILGDSKSKIFCKAEALNNAYKKSTGQVIVVLDADAYISGNIIDRCADKILENKDNHLWYVPYRKLYRLNKKATNFILSFNPKTPIRLRCPLRDSELLDDDGSHSSYGHRYAAMIYIVPREAIEVLGCFDERFEGWGGEDVSMLRALDTLYGKHKSVNTCLYHLWHPFLGNNYLTRKWAGQKRGSANQSLSSKYNKATNNPTEMRKLVDEGCKHCKNFWCKLKKMLCKYKLICSIINFLSKVSNSINNFFKTNKF